MRIGINNPYGVEDDFELWSRFNREADTGHFHQLVRGDTQPHTMEMVASLALLAQQTTQLRMGPTISNPITRHPGVMASAFGTLHKVSGGRVWLGLGVGNSAVRDLGMKPAKLADLEEYVAAFRGLLAEGEATYRGARCVLPWGPRVVPEGIPVVLAANGPKSLHLAGRIADGVIVGGGVTEEVVETTFGYLEAGAKEAGRSVDDIDVWFQVVTAIADTDERVFELSRDVLAAITSRNFRNTLEGKGLPPELEPNIRAFEADYRYSEHVTNEGHNGALLEKHGLTEVVTGLWLVGGTPDTVVRRLEEISAWGVRNVQLVNMAAEPDGSPESPFRFLARMREEVVPRL